MSDIDTAVVVDSLKVLDPEWPIREADTGQQCRAARGLLDWTQEVLAEVARIGIATVRQFEGGHADSRQATLAVLRRAFEEAGVDFIDENGGGPGVRMRRRQARKRKNA